MIIIGGRIHKSNEAKIPIEVLNLSNFKWSSAFSILRIRHCSFILNKYVFIHGGYETDLPNNAVHTVEMFDAFDLLKLLKV